MTVLIGMFLLGLSIALGSWVVSWSDHVKSELQVKVFFVDVGHPEAGQRRRRLPRRRTTRIKEYHFVSKTEALKEMRKKYPQLTAEPPVEPAARLVRGDAGERRRRRR